MNLVFMFFRNFFGIMTIVFFKCVVTCCVWLVALAGTKLIKETEPIGKSAGFSE